MIYSVDMMKNELKKEVQKQLWRLGKKVRDMAGIPGVKYDLLVDEKIRVCVLDDGIARPMSALKENCDVLAGVFDGKKKYRLLSDVGVQYKNPTEIFGPKE